MTFQELQRRLRRLLRKDAPVIGDLTGYISAAERDINTQMRAAVDAATMAAFPSMIIPGPWGRPTVAHETRLAETDEQNYYSVRARLGLDNYRRLVRQRVECLDLTDPTAIY